MPPGWLHAWQPDDNQLEVVSLLGSVALQHTTPQPETDDQSFLIPCVCTQTQCGIMHLLHLFLPAYC